ncbi:DUF4192 domain-containing protein [Corynebacterium sp. H130]|uniref:DUF4192 domain-containing protein n=1 Tax=Corynebacterium sp. H130 TaxID=3133444 RepID=UPI0030AEADCC
MTCDVIVYPRSDEAVDNSGYPQLNGHFEDMPFRENKAALILRGMSTHPDFTPGFLISNIPGVLGYHPENSLIAFLFFRQAEVGKGGRYVLGPMLRADFGALNHDSGFVDYIAHIEPDLVFGVVVGTEGALECAREFEVLCHETGVPLSAVWHVPELFSGAQYTRITGEGVDGLSEFTSFRQQWDQGEVAEILASPAMASFVQRGDLPAINRRESYAYFEPTQQSVTIDGREQLTRDCIMHAESLIGALEASDAFDAELMTRSLIDDFQDIIDRVISYQLSEDEIEADNDIIEHASVYFGHTWLRDALLDYAVGDYSAAFYRLCVAVARVLRGEPRAHALCCAAMAASFIGHNHRVPQALELANVSCPRHRLTYLMQEALHCGGLTLLYRACVEGARLARVKLVRG